METLERLSVLSGSWDSRGARPTSVRARRCRRWRGRDKTERAKRDRGPLARWPRARAGRRRWAWCRAQRRRGPPRKFCVVHLQRYRVPSILGRLTRNCTRPRRLRIHRLPRRARRGLRVRPARSPAPAPPRANGGGPDCGTSLDARAGARAGSTRGRGSTVRRVRVDLAFHGEGPKQDAPTFQHDEGVDFPPGIRTSITWLLSTQRRELGESPLVDKNDFAKECSKTAKRVSGFYYSDPGLA